MRLECTRTQRATKMGIATRFLDKQCDEKHLVSTLTLTSGCVSVQRVAYSLEAHRDSTLRKPMCARMILARSDRHQNKGVMTFFKQLDGGRRL